MSPEQLTSRLNAQSGTAVCAAPVRPLVEFRDLGVTYTRAGVQNVDPLHIKVMLIYGNGTKDVLNKVVLYSILPYVFTGLRYSAAVALILLVAVELVGAQSGVGSFLVQAQSFLHMPQMSAAIVVFGVLGSCANFLVEGIERRVIRWRPEIRS